ncbi:hypothetical protein M3231_11780 [Neobacillus mesonae]|nr:hypothetical protein [Neobacillus mesonae]
MGNEADQRSKRIEDTLLLCEMKDKDMHNRLSYLLRELQQTPGINLEALQEIEDLYIQKGIIFASEAYIKGYGDGKKLKNC